MDMGTLYNGVRMNTSSSDAFALAFDSRGVRTEMTAGFDPLVITGQRSPTKSVRVSVVGNVRVE